MIFGPYTNFYIRGIRVLYSHSSDNKVWKYEVYIAAKPQRDELPQSRRAKTGQEACRKLFGVIRTLVYFGEDYAK